MNKNRRNPISLYCWLKFPLRCHSYIILPINTMCSGPYYGGGILPQLENEGLNNLRLAKWYNIGEMSRSLLNVSITISETFHFQHTHHQKSPHPNPPLLSVLGPSPPQTTKNKTNHQVMIPAKWPLYPLMSWRSPTTTFQKITKKSPSQKPVNRLPSTKPRGQKCCATLTM